MEASAGDVNHASDIKVVQEGLALRYIDARWTQQDLSQRRAQAMISRQIQSFADLPQVVLEFTSHTAMTSGFLLSTNFFSSVNFDDVS